MIIRVLVLLLVTSAAFGDDWWERNRQYQRQVRERRQWEEDRVARQNAKQGPPQKFLTNLEQLQEDMKSSSSLACLDWGISLPTSALQRTGYTFRVGVNAEDSVDACAEKVSASFSRAVVTRKSKQYLVVALRDETMQEDDTPLPETVNAEILLLRANQLYLEISSIHGTRVRGGTREEDLIVGADPTEFSLAELAQVIETGVPDAKVIKETERGLLVRLRNPLSEANVKQSVQLDYPVTIDAAHTKLYRAHYYPYRIP